jgi:hypothetical protein
MTNPKRSFALLASALLILGPTAASEARSHARPFAVTLDGNASPVFQPDGCTIINDEEGTGHARHMGAIAWQSHEVVETCLNPAGADVTGQFVLTAANGDQVFGTYTTLAHLDFGAGQVTAFGHFQITGGTGRFSGAGGSGVISAIGSLAPPFAVLGGMSGAISY